MSRHHATSNGNVPFTAAEEAEWDAMEAEWAAGADDRAAEEARTKRDKLLAECDWTQVLDAPVDQIAWATYRQALRDITKHANFPNLQDTDWPETP